MHAFVPSIEASEHVQTLGDFFWYGSTILRTCSPESQMALFGHKFCRGDLTVDRSVLCNQDGCSFRIFIFIFISSWRVKFFPFRYRHSTKRNVGDKGTWSQKELEWSADAWATKFVETNLRPQLASWLRELNSFFPEELPFSTCRVGRSCFTAMAVTENYQSTPHTDKDLCNSVISWFLEGECSL